MQLKSRRLQEFSGAAIPPWLSSLCAACVSAGLFSEQERPDHVLINEYEPGQGILPHTDGPSYHPRVLTISLCSRALMYFRPRLLSSEIGVKDGSPVCSLLLEPGSGVLFHDAAYTDMLHSIEAAFEERTGECAPCANAPAGISFARSTRISVTLRKCA